MEQPIPKSRSNGLTKTIVFTALGIFLLLFVALSVITFFRRNASARLAAAAPTPSVSKEAIEAKTDITKLPQFPRVSVGTWNFLGAAAIAGHDPAQASVFTLKENLTKSDFARLSLKFGLQPTAAEDNGERIMAGNDRGQESAILYMQKKSGAFMYKATDGFTPASSSAAELEPQRMQAFVNDLIDDPTVRFSASYQKKSIPGVTFYEFHRDWGESKLPIVSMLGLFNLPDQVKLSQLESVKERREAGVALSDDPDITASTDGADNKARANDFNTLTIGVKNGKIVTVVSKLRLLTDRPDSAVILPYIDAVKRLETDQYAQILTSPSGTGRLDHNVVYPENNAKLRSVTVTDSRLVYIEELPPIAQSKLVPYFVFKGYGVMTSGYRVNVLASVAATQSPVTPTLIPSPTAKPTAVRPTQITPVPTEPALITSKCITPPNVNDLSNVQTDKSGMIFGQLLTKDPSKSSDPEGNFREWFVIPITQVDVQQLSNVIDSIYSKLGSVQKRRFMRLARDYELAAGNNCALRITGESPTVFLYSDSPTSVTILPSKPTYADPGLLEGIWNVNVQKHTLTANKQQRDYIYYEYERVSFNKPTKGWMINKSNISNLVGSIEAKLGLSYAEKERLLFEINHVARDYKIAKELFIGLIPQEEVDRLQPIRVSPAPDKSYRYHFWIGDAQNGQNSTAADKTVQPPRLAPIVRRGLTLVEFGATHGN